jgi:hypothetical protein
LDVTYSAPLRPLAINPLGEFFSVNGYVFRRLYSKADLIPSNLQDHHGDFLTDPDGLARFSGKYKHRASLL